MTGRRTDTQREGEREIENRDIKRQRDGGDSQTEKQSDRVADKKIGRHIKRQMDREKEKEIYTEIEGWTNLL